MFGLMRFHGEPGCIDEQRRRWRLHYCGTCKTIGRQYGQRARMLLNHDAVFLAELVTALGARDVEQWSDSYKSWNCMRLPEVDEMPRVLRYVAAINVLLSEYKVADHAVDSRHARWRWVRRFFSRSFRRARTELKALGFNVSACDEILGRQAAVEARCTDLDSAAEPTAQATALVFEHGSHLSGLQPLGAIGYRFGKLIYFLDAWEDFERDQRTGAFNPLLTSGVSRDWAAGRIREEAAGLVSSLGDMGAPLEFQSRFRANIESRLGARFPILHACRTRAKTTLAVRWKQAIVKARSWETAGLALAPVAAMAFLFPVYARSARSAHECLSMGLNLMALGGLFAAAGGAPELPQSPAPGKVASKRSCNWCCCDVPDCDCCCDGCDGCDGCDCG